MRIRARNARLSAAPVSKRPKGTHLWMLPSHLQRVFYEKLTAPLVAAAKPAPGVVEELRGSKAAGLNLWADPSADYSVRMITRRVLETFKYKVHEATCAREAVEVWRQHAGEIALLLTDIVMPEGVSGRDLADKLRAEKPGLHVIFMSGYSADVVGKDTEFFRRTGSCFLHKPCPTATLIQTVRKCFDENTP
jgi:CheY-like chemotaxis protein